MDALVLAVALKRVAVVNWKRNGIDDVIADSLANAIEFMDHSWKIHTLNLGGKEGNEKFMNKVDRRFGDVSKKDMYHLFVNFFDKILYLGI
jgi:hypothetical protein